jgi:hypothetical protein
MRRICLGIAGIVLSVLAGCSDTSVQEGPVPFKGTSTEPFNAMKNQMQKNVQGGTYGKTGEAAKPGADAKTAAPTTTPGSEAKPATDTKPAEKKPG